ncbi:MAG TPA: hypothetical protein VL793_07810 [Patescibacteria group bacterium]|nr:hypothetical protein [Patescibacteria group bacterium]
MREKQNKEGRYTQHAHGLGTVTEEMVRQRAAELALINGRPPGQVLDSDIRQACRELTGSETLVPSPTAAEELTEDERWQPVPESKGRETPAVQPSDEQTFAEKLVEEGVEDAEQDSMVQGTRQSQKRDRRV